MSTDTLTAEEARFEKQVDMVARTIEEHAYRHRVSNSPYGHVCPSSCLAEAVLRRLARAAREAATAEAEAEADDDEKFCPDCFAGIESAEHREKCGDH